MISRSGLLFFSLSSLKVPVGSGPCAGAQLLARCRPCPAEVSLPPPSPPPLWEGRASAFAPSGNVPRCCLWHSNPWPEPYLSATPRDTFSALLPDNHDIISLKLYQLTVERTPEEEKRDREVYLPVVDNLKLPGSE